MRSQLITYFRGSVRVQVRGNNPEQILDRCTDKHILAWDVRRRGPHLEMTVHLSDFFRLRPLLKETGCRIHVLERGGFPFFLQRMERRKFFAAGLVLFVLGLYLLSSLVWNIQVTGNERITKEEVLAAARKHGMYVMQWKFRLDDPSELSRRLMGELPDAAWIGVEVQGTRIRIEVVEAVRPEERELLNPRHLVASHDAVVTRILAERGKPMVQPNQAVKKGQILISGLIGNESTGGNRATVAAKGEVRGLVLYEYRIEMPLHLNYKVYTGESFERSYLVIGNRGIQVTGYGNKPYPQHEVIGERSGLSWRQFRLPFGWLKETVMEVRIEKEKLEPDEAKQIAMQQARADVLLAAGTDAKIVSQNILHERTDNGKVYIKALFEVDQSITKELAIIPIPENQGD